MLDLEAVSGGLDMAERHISHLERLIMVNRSTPLQKPFLNWDSKDIKRKLVGGRGVRFTDGHDRCHMFTRSQISSN